MDDNKRINIKPLPEKPKQARKPAKPKGVLKGDKRAKAISEIENTQASQQDVNQINITKRPRGRPKMPLSERKLGPLQKMGFKVPKTPAQLDALALGRIALRKKRAERKKAREAQFVSAESQSAEAAAEDVARNATNTQEAELQEHAIAANPQRAPLTDPGDTPQPWNTKQELAANLKREELDDTTLKLDNSLNFTTKQSNMYTLDGARSSQGETGRIQNKGLKQPNTLILDFL